MVRVGGLNDPDRFAVQGSRQLLIFEEAGDLNLRPSKKPVFRPTLYLVRVGGLKPPASSLARKRSIS